MTTPTLVNSYGSAKHTVINTNGQSVVYWNPLKISGTIEGVTWGKQAQATLEGELPRVPSIQSSVYSIKIRQQKDPQW